MMTRCSSACFILSPDLGVIKTLENYWTFPIWPGFTCRLRALLGLTRGSFILSITTPIRNITELPITSDTAVHRALTK
jgi:hypothetical protein